MGVKVLAKELTLTENEPVRCFVFQVVDSLVSVTLVRYSLSREHQSNENLRLGETVLLGGV